MWSSSQGALSKPLTFTTSTRPAARAEMQLAPHSAGGPQLPDLAKRRIAPRAQREKRHSSYDDVASPRHRPLKWTSLDHSALRNLDFRAEASYSRSGAATAR